MYLYGMCHCLSKSNPLCSLDLTITSQRQTTGNNLNLRSPPFYATIGGQRSKEPLIVQNLEVRRTRYQRYPRTTTGSCSRVVTILQTPRSSTRRIHGVLYLIARHQANCPRQAPPLRAPADTALRPRHAPVSFHLHNCTSTVHFHKVARLTSYRLSSNNRRCDTYTANGLRARCQTEIKTVSLGLPLMAYQQCRTVQHRPCGSYASDDILMETGACPSRFLCLYKPLFPKPFRAGIPDKVGA